MKQVLLGKKIVVSEVPAPGLGSNEVLVEVAYSFISTGTEVAGVKAAGGGVIAKIKQHPQRVGQVLEMLRVNGVKKTLARVRSRLESRKPIGYSCSGRVIAVGSSVTGFAVGDLVACGGQGYATHAEIVAVPSNLVVKLPDGCDLRSASGAAVASIALHGIRRGDLRLGETAVVCGLGLLGQISLQLLSAAGIEAIGFDPNPQRVEEGKALGVSTCFALTGEEAVAEVLTRTSQKGADATLITAATDEPGICQNAMEWTRQKGKVVVVGAVPLQFDRDPFYRKEIDFLCSRSYGPGRYDTSYEEGGQEYPYAYVRWTENRNMQGIVKMIADGSLDLDRLISAEYSHAEADKGYASLSAEGGDRPLGVVLKYDFSAEPSTAKLTTTVRFASPKPLEGRIGLGIIGVGQFCRGMHLPNLSALRDRYRIVAVCDKIGALAQDVARQYGAGMACSDPEELFGDENVQLVLITTRHDTHAPLTMAALKAGKHVFTEKPMAMNESELVQLLEMIDSTDRYYMVGFNRRFSPHVVRLGKLLSERVSPLVVDYRIIADPAPLDSWIYSSVGGGRAIGEACHMLDLFNFLVGDEVESTELDVIAPPVGTGGPPGDNFVASLRYSDGSLCTLTYSTLGRKSKTNGKERLEAMWDGKTFVIDDFVRSFGSGCSAGAAGNKKGKGHHEELIALGDFLAGKAPEPIGLNSCVRATRMSFMVDAACRGSSDDAR